MPVIIIIRKHEMSAIRAVPAAIFAFFSTTAFAAGAGSLDTTFNAPLGYNTIAFDVLNSSKKDTPQTIALHADGSIYVGGTVATAAAENQAIAKLMPDGKFDAAFGKWVSNAVADTQGLALTLTPDGPCIAGFKQTAGQPNHAYLGCNTSGFMSFEESGWSAATPASRTTQLGEVFEMAGYRTQAGTTVFEVSRIVRSGQTLSPVQEFGIGGSAMVSFGDASAATAIVRAPDNGVYVAGYVDGLNVDFAVAKLTDDGELDASFSMDGKATVGFDLSSLTTPPIIEDIARAIALDKQGRIIVAGEAFKLSSGGAFAEADVALVRLAVDGSPDPSFGPGGRRVYSFIPQFPQRFDHVRGTAVDSKGRIYVVGTAQVSESGNTYDIAVMRILPSGDIDSGFGNQGRALFDFSEPDSTRRDVGVAIVVSNDQPVILAERQWNNSGDTDFVVFRLVADDTIFANGFEQP